MIVSVVIPVYNRRSFIRQCLESVLCQDFKGDYEVIVVDGGSTDGTADVLREFSSRIKAHYTDSNQGLSCTRNLGIQLSQGQFIAMIDSDCIAYPQWLTQLIKPFEQNKEIMMVGGKVDDIVLNYWQMVNKGINFVSYHSGYVTQIIGCNMALRKEFGISHPYDKCFNFVSGEDTELCWRCKKLGFKIYYTPDAIVQHHHRSTLRSSIKQQFLCGYGNTCLTLKYNKPPYLFNGSWLIIFISLFLLMGCLGNALGFQLAAVGALLFSFLPLYHSIRTKAKSLYEIIITYPGNYLLYSSRCIGTLAYFFFPRHN